MIVGDILDQECLDKIVENQDVIYHFAGIADIDACAANPVDTAKHNILGTVQLLEACRKVGIQRFVFASSAYVYSDSGSFYAASKQACESFIENFSELYGLKYTCLRYGSLYGARSDERNSIYKLIKQAVQDGKIVYRGTGEEMREFIHVQDAAQISAAILQPEFENQNIIITGTEKMRYIELLEMIKEMLGNKIEIDILIKIAQEELAELNSKRERILKQIEALKTLKIEEAGIELDDIAFVLEDRDSMVAKFRELGVKCLQVAEGNF